MTGEGIFAQSHLEETTPLREAGRMKTKSDWNKHLYASDNGEGWVGGSEGGGSTLGSVALIT